MRRRSSWAFSLGFVALFASWLAGSKPAAVVGIGFVAAAVAARLWARVIRGSIELERRLLPGERVEGADLVVDVRGARRWGPLGGTIVLRQRLGPLEEETRMLGAHTTITFSALHRGRHRLEPLAATLLDPLGLERVELCVGPPKPCDTMFRHTAAAERRREQRVDDATDVLIRPRIPVLTSVFSSRGTRETGAVRYAFRQPAGFEIHAVREYVPGEPVRSVHWPSTARRGHLMVKELDDAPREDLTVVLDLDPDGVAGPPGSSSFDAAVRAVGAIAYAHLLWGRRVAIVGTASTSAPIHIRTSGHDWEVALDALAAAEPVAGATIEQALHRPASPLRRARQLVVVTGRPGAAAEALVELGRSGRAVSIVAVASETYAGRPRRSAEAALLRAASGGIPVAVVSADTPIELALAARPEGAVGA